MARETMSTLISTVRNLIQDTTELTDNNVQDALDRYAQRILRHKLTATHTNPADGLYYWFQAHAGHWENRNGALAIQDSEGTALALSESDLTYGLWKLATGTTNKTVYLVDGYTYDVYSAAVECLRILIAKIKDEYTFSSDEGSFQRDSRIRHLGELINQYRGAIRPYVLQVAE